ncbi:MAG TPA: D-2-hydroxyacid dehydrogenase [Clostridia bacterium]|nr:D-2-hydroxyacid dehydrogenase [Clostridia bacterium]
MRLLIVLHHRFELWNAPDWVPTRLRQDFSNLEVVHLKNYDEIDREIVDAEVAVLWSLRPEQLRAAKRLRWIHSPAAAVHALMIPEVIASDIVVTNASEVHGHVVAEHAVAMVFALSKRLHRTMHYQHARTWGQNQLWDERPRPRELRGATLGVIGLGAIGREVARMANAIGMNTLAVREHPERGSAPALQVVGFESIDEVLGRSDFVVLAAPLTPKTRACINADRLRAMRPEAYFVNVSRGALVDEPALIDALRNSRIAGAALDVFANEPLSGDSELWSLPNLIITPHSAAATENLWERHYQLLAENLRRYKSGEPLLGVVDKQKGY